MQPYFKLSQTIARPIEQVFATAIRLDKFPEWSPLNPSGEQITPGEVGEGTRFRLAIKGFGKVTQELREFQPNRRMMVTPISPMFSGGHRWIFSDLGDGTTKIDHELEMRPKGIFVLMGPMMRANGRKTVIQTTDALKRHLEKA